MSQSVNFDSGGFRIAGNLYLPGGPSSGKRQAIVVGHQASAVKEQAPALYAHRLAEQGFVVLTFDTGTQGESSGEIRGVEDPARRVEEFKTAVSFLSLRDEVNPEGIGLLGICASGGYVVPAAATDHRVRAVATVSGVDLGRIYREGPDSAQDPAVFQSMLDAAAAARTAEARGGDVGYFPIFQSEAAAKASGPFMSEGWDYYCTPRAQHPRSAKRFTLSSADMLGTFDAFQFAGLIAPRPLLIVVGRRAVTAANSMRSFECAKEPKEVFWIEGASHVDMYDKPEYVIPAIAKLVEFFRSNLHE